MAQNGLSEWTCPLENLQGTIIQMHRNSTWGKVSKNGPSKIYGRKPSKNLKGYGFSEQTISLQMF